MSSDDIHKARIFDIGAGMGVSLESSIKIVNARSLELLKRAKADFRSFIDSATPSIYPINITNDVIEPLYKVYEISVDKEVFKKEVIVALKAITTNISTTELQQKIDAAVTKNTNRVAYLQDRKSSHLEYRNAFYTLGNDIATLFSTRVNLLITDPESMGLSGKMVFIGKSFSGLKDNINKTINSVLRKYTTDSKASFGNVMAAGHTAVSLGMDMYGTNTPATQEALFRLEASKSKLINTSTFTNEFVKRVPLFLNNSITFNENFTPTAKTLLNLGFTFIVPMDSALNSASGSVEVKAIKDIIGNTVLPGIADAMKGRLAWLKTKVTGISGSPTAKEYILKNLKNALDGITLESSVYSETKNTKQLLEILIPDIKAISLKLNKAVAPGNVSSTLKSITKQTYSLVSLQSLINDSLQNVISANMGNGSSRSTLNYQTGRFAASVKVERMSQSREGMITAFYSYMKNPYQTFEPGYAQGSPKTRDPKLLIAKSIREIAATKVGNRLRAVSV